MVVSDLARTPLIELEWQGPDTRNDITATYAADVFSYIVNQNSSKLRLSLLQSGLATNVSIGYLTLKHTGPITLTIAPDPERIKQCMDEINRQISLMDEDSYITDAEIDKAKRMLEIAELRKEDITSDFVHDLAFWWASATLDYYFTYLDNLRKISRSDLKRYVETYIKNKPYCEGLLVSPGLKTQVKVDDFIIPGR
jgi:zinc protease